MHDEHQTDQSETPSPGRELSGDAAAPPAAAPSPEPEVHARDEDNSPAPDTLDQVVQQRDEYYDQLLRTKAEFDNYRKRTDRERRNLIEHAASELLDDLLPIVDDLERALATQVDNSESTGTTEAYRRGVEIIHKQLMELMTKRGVSPIEALGTDFDPTLHQAVTHEPSDTHRDGEIIEELRRGYTLGDRLLRASMVKVAKA
jgi:molecular chaperone GrpE